MADVIVYSSIWCPHCARAKALLTRKGVVFQEVDIDAEPTRRGEMSARAGGRTSVPQIFIDGRHIGGNDDLHALEAKGALDALLSAGGAAA